MRYTANLALAFFIAIGLSIVPSNIKLEKITEPVRDDYIRRAQVWHNVDVANQDIWAGPQNDISVPPETVVTCQYVEPSKPPIGAVPKFKCRLPSGQVLRIKYGGNTRVSREVFAEVAGTRLLWALGFYADEVYPVKIDCLGCPERNPWHPSKDERRVERIIDPAIMEREFPGAFIETYQDQGWKWAELDEVDQSLGGAGKIQIDALKLLAVFLQHSDNKPDQQRLACYREDLRDPDGDGIGFCSRPVMMIQDLGTTFGSGSSIVMSKMDLEGWGRRDIWNASMENSFLVKNHQKACFGNLTNSVVAGEEGLRDPMIGEAGRKFLADLLNQLTDKQIEDLFRVARADQVHYLINEHGTRAVVTIDDWVKIFKKKRVEINQRQCPFVVEHR